MIKSEKPVAPVKLGMIPELTKKELFNNVVVPARVAFKRGSEKKEKLGFAVVPPK